MSLAEDAEPAEGNLFPAQILCPLAEHAGPTERNLFPAQIVSPPAEDARPAEGNVFPAQIVSPLREHPGPAERNLFPAQILPPGAEPPIYRDDFRPKPKTARRPVQNNRRNPLPRSGLRALPKRNAKSRTQKKVLFGESFSTKWKQITTKDAKGTKNGLFSLRSLREAASGFVGLVFFVVEMLGRACTPHGYSHVNRIALGSSR